MQTVMKPNLYASLDMIPEIGMNDQSNGWNDTQKGLLHHELGQKRYKIIRNGPNYRKGGKKFQKFEKFL